MPAKAGAVSLCWHLKTWIWLRTLLRVVRRLLVRASELALANWGITMAARMPRMMTTMRISTRVNPRLFGLHVVMLRLLYRNNAPHRRRSITIDFVRFPAQLGKNW